jgi:hypothetical protein
LDQDMSLLSLGQTELENLPKLALMILIGVPSSQVKDMEEPSQANNVLLSLIQALILTIFMRTQT